VSIITPDQRQAARPEAVRAEVRITVNTITVNASGVDTLERTYGPPRSDGFGAKRAVRKFGEALRRLAD